MKKSTLILLLLFIIITFLVMQLIYTGQYSSLLNMFGYKSNSQYEGYARYRNPTFGFEFMYPSDLKISESSRYDGDTQFRVSLRFSPDQKSNAQVDILKIQNSGASIKDFYNIKYDPTYYSGEKIGNEIVQKETLLLDGVPAYKYPRFPTNLPIDGYYQDRLFLSKNSEIFEIIVTWDDREKALFEPIYDIILSSFRFVDKEIKEITLSPLPVDFSQTTSYTNDFLGITFDYIPNANIEPQVEEGGNGKYGFLVQHSDLLPIEIFLNDNPKNLSAREWFISKRDDYHPTLIREIEEIVIDSGSILIMGQPSTCQTVPMLIVFISHNGKMYTFWQTALNNDHQTTFELQTILSNLIFNDSSLEKISIPKQLLRYPSGTEIKLECQT